MRASRQRDLDRAHRIQGQEVHYDPGITEYSTRALPAAVHVTDTACRGTRALFTR